MKKEIRALGVVMVILLTLAMPVIAETESVTYPGYIWNEVRTQASPVDNTGLINQGVMEQGIQYEDIFTSWKPNFFIELRYDINPGGPAWYNKAATGAGFKLKRSFREGTIQLGVRHSTEFWSDHKSDDAAIGFCTLYYQWK